MERLHFVFSCRNSLLFPGIGTLYSGRMNKQEKVKQMTSVQLILVKTAINATITSATIVATIMVPQFEPPISQLFHTHWRGVHAITVYPM
jgi:hypothetical protein